MKKIIILLSCLWSVAQAQWPGYTTVNTRLYYPNGNGFGTINLPAGGTPALAAGQNPRAGAFYVDTTGGNKGVHWWNGSAWIRMYDTTMTVPTLYTSDGNLTGSRILNAVGNNLQFLGIGSAIFNADTWAITGTTSTTLHGTDLLTLSSNDTIRFTADGGYKYISTKRPARITDTTGQDIQVINANGIIRRIPSGIYGGGSSTSPAGSTTYLQINRNGVFGATDSLNYGTANGLTVKNIISLPTATIVASPKNGVFFGLRAGNITDVGFNKIAIGVDAAPKPTTANNIIAIGAEALFNNIAGESQLAFGKQCLYNDTSGYANAAYGNNIGNVSGQYNSMFGHHAMLVSTTGNNNTSLGFESMGSNTTGGNNFAGGYYALHSNTTGTANTAMGIYAGHGNATGSYNVDIGSGSGVGEGNTSNKFRTRSNGGLSGNYLMYGDYNTNMLAINVAAGFSNTHNFQVNGTLKFVTGAQGNLKILQSDASGVADWVAASTIVGAVPTWQQTLTAGSTLGASAFNVVDGNSGDLLFVNGHSFESNVTGNGSYNIMTQSYTNIYLRGDSISLRPGQGRLNIDSLRDATTQTRLMIWGGLAGAGNGMVAAIAAGTNGQVLTVSGGVPAWITSTTVISGTYSPTKSNETNCSVSINDWHYSRVGDVVTVAGGFTIDPTLTATATSFNVDLPVASAFSLIEDCGGTSFCPTIVGMGAAVYADTGAGNLIIVKFVSSDINSNYMSIHFTYIIK